MSPDRPSFSSKLDGVTDLSPIPPRVQRHLFRVYRTISLALLCTTIGSVVSVLRTSGSSVPGIGLPLFFSVITLIYLYGLLTSNDSSPSMRRRRLIAFTAFALFQGMVLGPFIAIASEQSVAPLLTALAGSALIFAAFSYSAIYAQRRQYFFLGSLLSSALSIILLVSVVDSWIPTSRGFSLQLYGGFIIMALYILYDTQLIIERSIRDTNIEQREPVRDSVDIFIHLLSLFRHLLVIFIKNQSERKNRRRKE